MRAMRVTGYGEPLAMQNLELPNAMYCSPVEQKYLHLDFSKKQNPVDFSKIKIRWNRYIITEIFQKIKILPPYKKI